MYACENCEYITRRYHSFLQHLKHKHEHHTKLNVKCHIEQCPKYFNSIRSLLKHIRSKHIYFFTSTLQSRRPVLVDIGNKKNENPSESILDEQRIDFNGDTIGDTESSSESITDEQSTIIEFNEDTERTEGRLSDDQGQNVAILDSPITADDNVDFVNLYAKCALQLRETHKLSSSATNHITGIIEDISRNAHEFVIQNIKDSLQQNGIAVENIPDLNEALGKPSPLPHACLCLNSKKKLEKYACTNFNVNLPVEYILHNLNVQTNDCSTTATYQYVPILKTLQYLLSFEDVFSQVINSRHSTNDELQDICDGQLYETNTLFSRHPSALQLILYVDEFSTVNPLGNKVKSQKLCAFYVTLGNISPIYRSRLEAIQLVALSKSCYIKKYGISAVLENFIEDVKLLERDGITVTHDNKEHTFYGTVLVVVADNLGAHQIGGFTESFIAERSCRFCLVTKNDLKNGQSGRVRTIDAYNTQCDMIKNYPGLSKVYGLNNSSILNQLEFYHVINGLPSDIAHDIFEGVGKDVLCSIIGYCIENRFITLDTLNNRIQAHEYYGSDKNTKPGLLSKNGNEIIIKETASQCWTLIRLLPLLIGDTIPQNESKWHVFMNFVRVVEFICAPKLSKGQVDFMHELISEFCTEYCREFPETQFRPKLHYIKHHYATQFRLFGPLIHLWTLRFESKHSELKQMIKLSRNSKNIAKSLAERHQFKQCTYSFQDKESLFSCKFDSVKAEEVSILALPEYSHPAICAKAKCSVNCAITKIHALKFQNTRFDSGTCIINGFEGDLVHFTKILFFVLIEQCPFALCRKLDTVDYDHHFNSYVVEDTDDIQLINASEINESMNLPIYDIPGSFRKGVNLKYKF